MFFAHLTHELSLASCHIPLLHLPLGIKYTIILSLCKHCQFFFQMDTCSVCTCTYVLHLAYTVQIYVVNVHV